MTRLALAALAAVLLVLASASAYAAVTDICAFPDTAAAQKAWEPQFGSPPVTVEKLPDGSTCVVLSGTFKQPGDRLCWDYVGPLDLSQAGTVSMLVRSENAGTVGNLGLYFGAPGGWYAHFGWGGPSDAWTRHGLQLGDFTTEDKPGGWGQVNRFRFSVWAAAAGTVTFRLKGFQALPNDPKRSYLHNGSFEIPGPLPYAWGSGHWGVGSLPWVADMDLWRRHFGLDHTVAYDGKTSLRLINEPGLPRLQAQSAWFGLRAEDSTFSAWLRADREGLPVRLLCGGKSATVTVGKTWQQATLPGVPGGGNKSAVIAPDAEGTLWIDAVQVQETATATPEFHPHPDDAALAEREATVDWTPPRRTAEVAAGRTTSGTVQAAKVSIDASGRFLLDGKPYLQHSLGLEFISDLGVLNAAAAAGFSDVCIEINKNITTAQLKSYFDRCAEVGLRVIPWLDGNIEIERFREHITTLRDHPALLVWYVFDEPSGDRFAAANERLALAHELDKNHPALINYLGNKLTEHMGDIFSTDIYPIPRSTVHSAIAGVEAMARSAAPEHKPVWMWLQGTGYAYSMDREPTPRELSCMVYGSLLAGARGIYYFAQFPRSAECWAEMRAMCVEVAAVAPVLGSLDQAPAVKCEAPAIMARAYRQGGEVWVLALNTRREPCEVKVSLPTAATKAEVVFEGREVSLAGGTISDTFGPFERHVYRLK